MRFLPPAAVPAFCFFVDPALFFGLDAVILAALTTSLKNPGSFSTASLLMLLSFRLMMFARIGEVTNAPMSSFAPIIDDGLLDARGMVALWPFKSCRPAPPFLTELGFELTRFLNC